MGSKKGGPKYSVTDYYMSVHYGICHGPVDALHTIMVKEDDEAWPGEKKPRDPKTVESTFPIDMPELFGGDKKEGGLVGLVAWLPGTDNQILPDVLAGKLAPGKTGLQVPGYRGIASVFFYALNRGFMWGQNNPYFPSAAFRVTRLPRGLNQFASIQVGDGYPDANPVNIIYECLTNGVWGLGMPTSQIDVASFITASETIFNENFGVSLQWTNQTDVESFVKEIIDHILAMLFLNPRTGKIGIRLLREDYVLPGLRHFNPDNCKANNRQRKSWGETVNEIVVTWTNPEDEGDETVTVQDLANIAMQGQIISDSRNYYGVRRADLAMELAERDVRSAAYPLFSVEIRANRAAFDLLPGEVCTFSWPEDGIDFLVMRVMDVDYGRPGEGEIKATLIEDIFSLETGEYSLPPKSDWNKPDDVARALDHVQIFSVPYPLLVRAGFDLTDDEYPRTTVGIFGAQEGFSSSSFHVWTDVVRPTGAVVRADTGTVLVTDRRVTSAVWVMEASTSLPPSFGASLDLREGDLLFVGAGGDAVTEIVMLDTYNISTGQWVVARGVLDTVSRVWPAGTELWHVTQAWSAVDSTERLGGTVAEYQFTPRTGKSVFPIASAIEYSVALSARPHHPFRPANVAVDGNLWGPVVYNTQPVSTVVTWANRNRKTEDRVIRRWAEGNVTPEVGQTVTLKFISPIGTELGAVAGLTGTSHTVTYAVLAQIMGFWKECKIFVYAERDGLLSLQAHGIGVVRNFPIPLPGYGEGYGLSYGAA